GVEGDPMQVARRRPRWLAVLVLPVGRLVRGHAVRVDELGRRTPRARDDPKLRGDVTVPALSLRERDPLRVERVHREEVRFARGRREEYGGLAPGAVRIRYLRERSVGRRVILARGEHHVVAAWRPIRLRALKGARREIFAVGRGRAIDPPHLPAP